MSADIENIERSIAFLAMKAGFALMEEQCREYAPAYRHVAAMAAELQRATSYMAEPAHIYGYNGGDND